MAADGVANEHIAVAVGVSPTTVRAWRARFAEVSRSTVQRIWHARGLKRHLVDTFKISTDPAFEEKLTDVVGLYSNPIQPSW
jgi:hypothetical protein